MWHELSITSKFIPPYDWGYQSPNVYAGCEPLIDDLHPCASPSDINAPLFCWMVKLPANEQHCKIHSSHCKYNVENLVAVGDVLFQLHFIIPKLEGFGVNSSRKCGHDNGTDCDDKANNSCPIAIFGNFHVGVAFPGLWFTAHMLGNETNIMQTES